VNDPNVLNDHKIVNSPNVVNGPYIVNSSNVVNCPNVVNSPVDFGIVPKVWWVFFFYILSQHLDHLQQLDNLEHSAHLYGQLTTVML
jgi:hypothetical protein